MLLSRQHDVTDLSTDLHQAAPAAANATAAAASNAATTNATAATDSATASAASIAAAAAAALPSRLRLRHEVRAAAAEAASGHTAGGGGASLPLLAPRRIDSGPGKCSLLRGVRFDAPSIKVVAAPTGRACCRACRAAEYCNAFSWRRGAGEGVGRCWLKQWAGTAYAEASYVSGHFSRQAACGCAVTRKVALEGNTLATRAAPSPTECCAACLAASECRYWSWDPTNAGAAGVGAAAENCTLLGSGGGRGGGDGGGGAAPKQRASPGAASGVVRLKRGVMIVHHHPPHLEMGCDLRLLALAEQLRRAGHPLLFVGADGVDPGGRGRAELQRRGATVVAPLPSSAALVRLATQHDAAVVVLTLWFWGHATSMPGRYLRALRTSLPHVRLVILTDDVHHRRLELMAEHEAGEVDGGGIGVEAQVEAEVEAEAEAQVEAEAEAQVEAEAEPGGGGGGDGGGGVVTVAGAAAEAARVKVDELTHYYYADHVLTISAADAEAILGSLHAGRSMHPSRFTPWRHVFAEAPAFALAARRPFAARSGLLFVGNANNPTNLYGLRWFVRAVLPLLLRAEPEMVLRVAGSWEGEAAAAMGLEAQLRRNPAVQLLRYVADLGELLQASRLFVVPVRWATGVLTKQTLAHVHGIPTVVTPAAAAQVAPAPLDARGGANVWSHRLGRYERVRVAAVGGTAAAFAEAVLHAYRNATAWGELSLNGARFARSGGDGKGVCPSGLRDDVDSFWSKMQRTTCGGGGS